MVENNQNSGSGFITEVPIANSSAEEVKTGQVFVRPDDSDAEISQLDDGEKDEN